MHQYEKLKSSLRPLTNSDGQKRPRTVLKEPWYSIKITNLNKKFLDSPMDSLYLGFKLASFIDCNSSSYNSSAHTTCAAWKHMQLFLG